MDEGSVFRTSEGTRWMGLGQQGSDRGRPGVAVYYTASARQKSIGGGAIKSTDCPEENQSEAESGGGRRTGERRRR